MGNQNTQLRIVGLMDPSLCAHCRFSAAATVAMEGGGTQRMIHCKRLDCDNWQEKETTDRPLTVKDTDQPSA